MTEHQVRVRTSTGWQDLVRTGPTGPAGPAGADGADGADGTDGQGVLLLDAGAPVPPGTPVGTIIFRKA